MNTKKEWTEDQLAEIEAAEGFFFTHPRDWDTVENREFFQAGFERGLLEARKLQRKGD